jgi:uncharacterized repeat protein (TIGR01451 family)
MKKLYSLVLKTYFTKFIIIAIALISVHTSFSQVIVPFAPRTSIYTPEQTIYNIKGDFQLLGNTNMTLVTYGDESTNAADMKYVDIDGVDTTFNSSSAELVLSTENGAIPSCSNIIYAGLYWTGRAHDGESPNTFTVTKNIPGDTPEAVNYDYQVNHNGTINYTNYTMVVTRMGSTSAYYPRYTFTSSGDGGTVIFESLLSTNTPAYQVRYSTDGGSSWSIPTNQVVTTPTSNRRLISFDPVTIYSESGGIVLTVDALHRDARDDRDLADTQSRSWAYGNVSGTYYPPIPYIKNYDKSVVYLKHENAATYYKVSASDANFTSDIYYPTTSEGYMFSGYAEVTDYVQQHGIGDYFVADIAVREGNGGGTGFYGGWGLIVIYENSLMDRRDVIIFDGHAYVVGSTTINHELPVSGFQTTQSGPVNMKLGMIAGEGDRGIAGDYFEIRNVADDAWVALSHGGNSTGNFFNSSVFTGGNDRNPDILNNTGLDVSMFTIPNTDNTLIDNNDTSTTFRYGSTQDTYIIFCIAMAVDAYRPEPEALNLVSTINGNPPGAPLTAEPGQNIVYTLEIRNKGEEAMHDVEVVIPMPYSASYVSSSATFESYPSFPNGNLAPIFDAGAGATGSIIWHINYLPLPANKNELLATLTYTLKVTEDCIILSNTDCEVSVTVDGIIGGHGDITNIEVNDVPFIQGYEISGGCVGEPIYDPVNILIDGEAYVLANCTGTGVQDFTYCNVGSTIPITDVSGNFPLGCKFYDETYPDEESEEFTLSNPFPATTGTTTYYAVPPGITECIYEFTITVTVINTSPTPVNPIYCQDDVAVPLTATPTNQAYTLYYYLVSSGGSAQLSITPSTTTPGTFTRPLPTLTTSC